MTDLPSVEPSGWNDVPKTTTDLEWTQLETVDFAKLDTPEGRDEVVKTLYKALTTKGYFYLINHDFPQPVTDRFWDMAAIPFLKVPDEEKIQYGAVFARDRSLQGYKLRKKPGDQVENYAISPDITRKKHPEALHPYMPEIKEFSRLSHFLLVDKLLKLTSLALGLPEDTLSKDHEFEAVSESYMRFLICHPKPDDGKPPTDPGHTDSGTYTFLWSQPVISLQLLEEDGRWTWVDHIPNSIVINSGDMLELLSGGLFKSPVHRVIKPPPDLVKYTRYGLFYLSLAPDDLKLVPYADSPVLQKVGIKRRFADENAPTALQWREFAEGGMKWPGYKELDKV